MPRTRFLIPVLAVAGWLMAAPAQATLITYATTGAFDANALATSDSLTIGGLTIKFQGLTSQSVNTVGGFSFGNLGEFDTDCNACTLTSIAGHSFTLQITQTVPTAGSGQLIGTLTGSINGSNSSGEVTFNASLLTIGGISYVLSQNPVPLQPQSTAQGVKSIDVRITDLAVPEPTSMVLLGTGLMGLAMRMRRRQ